MALATRGYPSEVESSSKSVLVRSALPNGVDADDPTMDKRRRYERWPLVREPINRDAKAARSSLLVNGRRFGRDHLMVALPSHRARARGRYTSSLAAAGHISAISPRHTTFLRNPAAEATRILLALQRKALSCEVSSSNGRRSARRRPSGLRQRCQRDGLDGFEDHEVLELLFSYVPSARDKADISRRLLAHYGSLSSVLDADAVDLSNFEGLGEAAAGLLALIPSMARRYLCDRRRRPTSISTTERAADFVVPLMVGRTEEVFYVICLDAQLRPIVATLISRGSVGKSHVDPRHVVGSALRHRAHAVLLAHNHPAGTAKPTSADHRVTTTLVHALGLVGIRVVDHLIIADDGYFSFARAGDLPALPDALRGGV